MQEIQMALMEEPITQINKFSTQKLQNISYTFRVSRQQANQLSRASLKFDGKLHLDIKIDKLLLQIQQCKVNLAQILQMYLPESLNSIDFKQMKLSNLKKSQSEENKQENKKEEEMCEIKVKDEFFSENSQKEGKMGIINDVINMKQRKKELKFNRLRREDSYELSELEEVRKEEEEEMKRMEKIVEESQHKQSQLNEETSNMKNLIEKHNEGNQQGEELKKEIQDQQISVISSEVINSQIKNSSGCQLLQKIEKELINFKKTLMLRQAQLGMLIYITQSKHDETFIQKYAQIYDSLKQYVIPLNKINYPINIFVLQEVFQIQSKFLNQYQQLILQIKSRLQNYQNAQNNYSTNYTLSSLVRQSKRKKLQKALKSVYKLKIINSKFITIAQIFPHACVKDLNDLFSFNMSHQRWQKLIANDVITYKIYGQPQKVRASFQSLKNNLNIINASMSILNQSKNLSVLDYNHWGKLFQNSSKILKIALFKNDAHHQASVMISQPDGKLAKEIWNLPQNKALQNFISAVLPSIDFSQKIYIPRILKQYFYSEGKTQLPNELYIEHVTQYGNLLYEKAPYDKKIPCRINAKSFINRKYQTKIKNQKEEQKKDESYSKMFFNTLNSMTKTITNLNNYFKKQGTNSSVAILHIHGGGFISMSSFIHQTYTRNWAKNLDVPILSVDYGKAPQYPYPNGLYDCLEAYMWLRYVFRQIYNIEVQKVIIVGDSAGGNLAASLTTLLIQWNLPKPDGLVLVYPALNLDFNNYTPSLLHALNDMILPHTFLKICLNAYIKDHLKNPETDPLLSPIATKSDTLKKYPRTKIFVGGKDPFHDDCCRFVQKINDAKQGIADLTIFDQFPHGFLQFDMTTNPHQQARKAIKQVQNSIKEVINYKEK